MQVKTLKKITSQNVGQENLDPASWFFSYTLGYESLMLKNIFEKSRSANIFLIIPALNLMCMNVVRIAADTLRLKEGIESTCSHLQRRNYLSKWAVRWWLKLWWERSSCMHVQQALLYSFSFQILSY